MKLDFANIVMEFQKRLSIRVIVAFRFEFLLDQTNQTTDVLAPLFFAVRTITKIMAGKN